MIGNGRLSPASLMRNRLKAFALLRSILSAAQMTKTFAASRRPLTAPRQTIAIPDPVVKTTLLSDSLQQQIRKTLLTRYLHEACRAGRFVAAWFRYPEDADGRDEALHDPRIVLDRHSHHPGGAGGGVRGLHRQSASRRSVQARLCRDQCEIHHSDPGAPRR